MEKIKLKGSKLGIEKVKKENLLASSSNNYDYETYIFKIIYIGEDSKEELLGKKIVTREKPGIQIQLNGKDLIIISETDIIAEL